MQVEARRNGVCGQCATPGTIAEGGEERCHFVLEGAGGVAAADDAVRARRHIAGHDARQPALENFLPGGFGELAVE
jgi:hypothetical protein